MSRFCFFKGGGVEDQGKGGGVGEKYISSIGNNSSFLACGFPIISIKESLGLAHTSRFLFSFLFGPRTS